MSAPPKTVLAATAEEEAAIREAVRTADPQTLARGREIAGEKHIDDLVDLLIDPSVSEAIYDLPRPIDHDHVAAWVADYAARRERGEGLLIVVPDWGNGVVSYSQITVWPDRASAELAGAVRADMQGAGGGGEGAMRVFDWMFTALKVRLICLTAAMDNERSIRLIDRAGFQRMGTRDALRPDKSIRKSHYWELSREVWERLKRGG
ncbi:MAG: GNAT family protein [Micropepsaceae bacterium]